MRWLIFLTVILFSVGCETETETEFQERVVQQRKEGMSRFEFEGHTYIFFNDFKKAAMTHDPDCECNQ